MKTPKLRRLVGAVAVSALVLTACSSGGDEEPAGEATDEATPDDSATEDMATDDMATDDAEASADGYDWSDPNLRKAISMAINRQEIVDVIFQGTTAVADYWWPPTLEGYQEGGCANLAFDPEQAAALFEESGGDKGPMTIQFNEGHEDWIEAVANQLKTNLGIAEINFDSLIWADHLNRLQNGEASGPYRLGWLFDYPSPGNFLGPLYGTAGGSNYTGYSNPEFDEAYQAGDSKTVEEGVADYQAAADILCEDMPVTPVYFSTSQMVHSENVANVTQNAYQYVNTTEVEDLDGDGMISIYIAEPQNSLFGSMTSETSGAEVVNNLFTGLYSLEKGTSNLVFDGVAESIESDDDQTWTITLRDGFTYHDGTPVVAQDYVDAWNWASYAPNAAQNNYFFGVPGFVGYDEVSACGTREATQEDVDAEAATEVGEEITDCEGSPPPSQEMSGLSAPDDTTIQVELDAPLPQFPLLLLYNAFDPLPPDFFEAAEQGADALTAWGEAPNGNGPFMMDGTWEHNVGINLVAYPDYAGDDQPSVERVEFRVFENPDPAYLEVQSGNLDIITTVPSAELGNVEADFGDRYISEPTSVTAFIGFQLDPANVIEWHGTE